MLISFESSIDELEIMSIESLSVLKYGFKSAFWIKLWLYLKIGRVDHIST